MATVRITQTGSCCERFFDPSYPICLQGFVGKEEFANTINRINYAIKLTFMQKLLIYGGLLAMLVGLAVGGALAAAANTAAAAGFVLLVGGIFTCMIGRCMVGMSMPGRLAAAVMTENQQHYANKIPPVVFRIENPIVGFHVTVRRGFSSVNPIRRVDLCIDYGVMMIMAPVQHVVNNYYGASPHGVQPMSPHGWPQQGQPMQQSPYGQPPPQQWQQPQSPYNSYPPQQYPQQYGQQQYPGPQPFPAPQQQQQQPQQQLAYNPNNPLQSQPSAVHQSAPPEYQAPAEPRNLFPSIEKTTLLGTKDASDA